MRDTVRLCPLDVPIHKDISKEPKLCYRSTLPFIPLNALINSIFVHVLIRHFRLPKCDSSNLARSSESEFSVSLLI
jgi:hypothetical protein